MSLITTDQALLGETINIESFMLSHLFQANEQRNHQKTTKGTDFKTGEISNESRPSSRGPLIVFQTF
ncbi:Hypothetical protein P9303_12501 [Prochlorococcus marinus str. MIT 9303]|uniref:Uncharacterized protein n=1 Tax=Prochlorococcus marinus (strain MIT 9303) TaxID=59922 RepID=A2C938_PROM3|nr:Hypothetical protein P9303_12501 [Prochlorococcus marinus str. MIT 9303]